MGWNCAFGLAKWQQLWLLSRGGRSTLAVQVEYRPVDAVIKGYVMTKTAQRIAGLTLAGALALNAGAACAQSTPAATAAEPAAEPVDPVSVDFTLSAVSDYRFRGLSLSNKDPAFQPSITVTNDTGIYLSAWGSNIADNGGDNIEIDLTAGISRDIGSGFTAGALAVYYVYPGAGNTNYVEFQASASKDIGPASVGVLVAYAPRQANIGDVSNIYGAVNASVAIPSTPFTLTGSFGIEDGAFGNVNKNDWSLGVNATVKGFTLGASYIDTSRTGGNALGSAAAVFSISKTF